MASAELVKQKRKNASGNKSDPGWEHAIEIDSRYKKVKCKHCNKICSGGIYRLKHHLGCTRMNIEPCLQAPRNVTEKFRALLQSKAEESEKRKNRLHDIGELDNDEWLDETNRMGKGKGIIDRMVSKTTPKTQATLNQMYKKGEREEVCQQIARFLYTSVIPFNVVNNPEFAIMVEKIAKYGLGLKPPSFHEVRVKFLKQEVSNVKSILEEHKEEWKRTSCTIMSDGWTDRRRRTICNFLVNSPKGTVFLSSIDTSNISKTAEKVFEMLDDIVEKVGEANVVQVVTDNAANYKAAGEKLMEKRKRMFWTPCAAHCIDLMLEDFDKKIKIHGEVIAKAKKVSTFIYARTLVHTWLKEFTKGRELIRPGATRFATSYLTLNCLNELRGPLLSMFASNKWISSKFASTTEGKTVESIVLDTRRFWNGITKCLKASLPLVKVLRMVDSDDKPAMGFIYDAIEQARRQIKENFNNVEKDYQPILDIIDERWEFQLHRPLHAATYFLNPYFHYSPNFIENADIKIGFYNCLQRMVPDAVEKVKIDLQLDDFRSARGMFGLPTAVMTRNRKSPAHWWAAYGDECPELKRFAIRILSLTCSSSGCERNWSAFEMVHTKRRNRLHQQKLNDLVFVMYNLKLNLRKENQASSQKSITFEDIPSDDEWITDVDEVNLSSNEWLNILDGSVQDEDGLTYTSSSENVINLDSINDDEMENMDELQENIDDSGSDEGDDEVLESGNDTTSTYNGNDDVYYGDSGNDGDY